MADYIVSLHGHNKKHFLLIKRKEKYKKIPKRERDEIPLVAIGKDVLIVVGTEISDKVKINENTKAEYIFEITSEDN